MIDVTWMMLRSGWPNTAAIAVVAMVPLLLGLA